MRYEEKKKKIILPYPFFRYEHGEITPEKDITGSLQEIIKMCEADQKPIHDREKRRIAGLAKRVLAWMPHIRIE